MKIPGFSEMLVLPSAGLGQPVGQGCHYCSCSKAWYSHWERRWDLELDRLGGNPSPTLSRNNLLSLGFFKVGRIIELPS